MIFFFLYIYSGRDSCFWKVCNLNRSVHICTKEILYPVQKSTGCSSRTHLNIRFYWTVDLIWSQHKALFRLLLAPSRNAISFHCECFSPIQHILLDMESTEHNSDALRLSARFNFQEDIMLRRKAFVLWIKVTSQELTQTSILQRVCACVCVS